MDNAGDWIYFLIVIGVGIVSMINSAKKEKAAKAAKKATGPTHTSTPYEQEDTELLEEEKPKSFWEILQEIENASSPAEQPKPKAITVQPTPPKKETTPRPFLSHEAAISTMKQRHIVDESEEEEDPVLQEDLQFQPSDLRKAIIYSEIVNRKY